MFLSFVGSNVDEFFMVRVAGLKRQIEKGVSRHRARRHDSGGTAASHPRLGDPARIAAAYDCWRKELVPALQRVRAFASSTTPSLTDEQRAIANTYFQDTIFPTLTPLAFDPGRPFPAHLEPQPQPGRALARTAKATSTSRA